MWGWCGDASWPVWGWWLVPLIGMILCVTMCMLFRSRMTGRSYCCWGGGSADVEGMKKEIRELREEIDKSRKKENGNG